MIQHTGKVCDNKISCQKEQEKEEFCPFNLKEHRFDVGTLGWYIHMLQTVNEQVKIRNVK